MPEPCHFLRLKCWSPMATNQEDPRVMFLPIPLQVTKPGLHCPRTAASAPAQFSAPSPTCLRGRKSAKVKTGRFADVEGHQTQTRSPPTGESMPPTNTRSTWQKAMLARDPG